MLEPIYDWLQSRRQYQRYKHLEWTANETLHLQRLSYQGLGRGSWSQYIGAVPITEKGETLEPLALDIENGEIKFQPAKSLSKTETTSTNADSIDGKES